MRDRGRLQEAAGESQRPGQSTQGPGTRCHLLLVLFAVQICSGMLLASPPGNLGLFGDARIVADVAGFDFSSIRSGAGRFWILVEVCPDAWSGSQKPFRAEIHEGGMKILSRPKRRVHGYLFVQAHLAGDTGRNILDYQWDYSPNYFRPIPWRIEDDRDFSPYRHGAGSAIVHLDYELEYPDRIAETILIPPEWQGFVVPSLEFQRRDAMEQVGPATLIDDVDDENPFTAVAAFRTLLQARGSGTEEAREALFEARGWMQAVFVTLLLRYADDESRVELLDTIDQLTGRASSVEDLVPVALGVYSFPVSLPFSSRSQIARELREDIFELIRVDPYLRDNTEAARYVDSILESLEPW